MSHTMQQTSVSPVELASLPQGAMVLIDIRKPRARAASGLAIPGSVWRHPFDAANWAEEFSHCNVALFCVHGHEVSQAVCGYLRDMEIDAVIMEGGFEAWKQAGLPVETLAEADV